MTDLGLVLVVLLIVVLVWRGPKTLPKLGQALGRGVREARHEAELTREELSRRGDADAADATGTAAATDEATAQTPDRPDSPPV